MEELVFPRWQAADFLEKGFVRIRCGRSSYGAAWWVLFLCKTWFNGHSARRAPSCQTHHRTTGDEWEHASTRALALPFCRLQYQHTPPPAHIGEMRRGPQGDQQRYVWRERERERERATNITGVGRCSSLGLSACISHQYRARQTVGLCCIFYNGTRDKRQIWGRGRSTHRSCRSSSVRSCTLQCIRTLASRTGSNMVVTAPAWDAGGPMR
ncbi:hypothetical protein LZ30DRAFT_398815 [Colletotrichum cereale]|nr:hypothetical protein LZ30DRAFT_398815 [Colletotrichum cereale]